MRPLELARAAKADLKRIRRYTEQNWSTAQARRYVLEIDAIIEKLVNAPLRGRDAGFGGYRQQPAGSHMIYYRVTDDLLSFVRVLYPSMDVRRHLPS